MIRIMARISSRADSTRELQGILTALVDPTRKEPGCISYDLFQNEETASEFVTIERWADQAAADAHMTTKHVSEAIAEARNLLAQPPLIHRFRQLA